MRNTLILTTVVLVFVVAGCGGGSSGGGQQPISVSFLAAPPSTMTLGATASVSATVLNDSAAKGVTWSCAPSGTCGSFSATTTASGAATTYMAPSAAPAGGSVTITATSVSDGSKSAAGAISLGISVAISTAPPASLAISGTANISATVTNDPANGGVTWSCAPSGTCGGFSATTTASGATTVYTAPAAIPSGGSVTITAASVSDSTKTKSAAVTITGPVITITLTTPPTGAMQTGGTASIAATTTNDPAALPVVWSCAPSGSCGSFSLTSTASGATTTYTAPASVPTGGSVTITATSFTDSTKTASATVMITKPASVAMLNGKYAFLIEAPTSTRGTTTFVGSVQLDGAGNVLGGMEDIVATLYYDLADPILPTTAGPGAIPDASYYTVDASGHGTLRMKTNHGETLDLRFVLTSASHGQVIEADGDPGSGSLDLQSATVSASQITGPYAFTMNGVDTAKPPTGTLAFGGVFSADGASTLPSVTLDTNTNGSVLTQSTSGSFSAPDANGRGTLTLFVPIGRQFIYYMVSGKVLRLLENDNMDYMGGSAYAQGTVGTTLSGNYVYRHSGWNATGRTVAAGQFAATTVGAISGGTSDANAGGVAPTSHTSLTTGSGTYALTKSSTDNTVSGSFSAFTDAAGSSTFNIYPVDPTLNILDPNNATGKGGALLLHTDANIVGTGVIIPQSGTGTFTGNYALGLQNSIAAATPNELDLVGVLTSDGSANFANGLADYDQNTTGVPTPMVGAALTGTFATSGSHFTGGFSVTTPASGYPFIPGAASPTTLNVSIYQASASQAFAIETDTKANSEGLLVQQVIQ